MPDDDILGLVPVVVEAGGGGSGQMSPDAPGTIVLEIDGVRVLVPTCFDPDHLSRIIAALRAMS